MDVLAHVLCELGNVLLRSHCRHVATVPPQHQRACAQYNTRTQRHRHRHSYLIGTVAVHHMFIHLAC